MLLKVVHKILEQDRSDKLTLYSGTAKQLYSLHSQLADKTKSRTPVLFSRFRKLTRIDREMVFSGLVRLGGD